MVDLKCYRCNNEFTRNRVKSSRPLCDDCKRFRNTIRLIERYEKQLNTDDLGGWLYKNYIEEKKTISQIMKTLNTKSNNAMTTLFDFYNIPIRHGSEAVKLQWEGNEERKEQQRQLANKTIHTKESREKLKATMQTDEYRKKMSENRMGEKNPAYKPELDRDANRHRCIAGNVKWKRDIHEKYNYMCDKCGSTEKLNTHHLYNWSEYPEKRFDLDNGVLLCEKCHILFHHIYGQRNNTPEQYKKFKEED